MKNLFTILFTFLFIISCTPVEDELENCSFENGDIEWLNEKINDYNLIDTSNKVEIYQYTYNDETVFLINDCVNCADTLEVVYNCSGEVICEFGGIAGLNTCIDFETEATEKTLIWSNTSINNVIVDDELYNNTETEGYEITSVSVEGDTLKMSIKAGGCDGSSWGVNLIDASVILESLPVQRNIKVGLVNTELCRAFAFKDYEFNISSLQVNGEQVVHFNLEGWNEKIVYNYGGEEKSTAELLLGNWSNVVYEEEVITFEKVTELIENANGFTFKEEFPTCIERSSEGVSDAYVLPTFYDLERYYALEGDNLKIYDLNIPTYEGAVPILLHNYKIVSIDENKLVLENIIDEQTNDLKELQELFSEIELLANSVSCEETVDWGFIGYGSKACGGFQGYIAYSTTIDVESFKDLVEKYTEMEKEYNIEHGIVSTCDITPQPTAVECVNGEPQFIYNTTD